MKAWCPLLPGWPWFPQHLSILLSLTYNRVTVGSGRSMRTCHKHSCTQWSTGWVWHCPRHRREREAKYSTAAFPKLFTFREVGRQVSPVTRSCPSLRTVTLPPCLPLDIKDSLKEDVGFFDGDWWKFFEGDWWKGFWWGMEMLIDCWAAELC
jgi:hypothetical protein